MSLNTPALEIAKILRKQLTPAEKILWQELRNKQLGEKFRRQMPFIFDGYRFVADFYCVRKKLVIEVDGEVHDNPEVEAYDQWRDEVFRKEGCEILRIRNEEIYDNLHEVILKIQKIVRR